MSKIFTLNKEEIKKIKAAFDLFDPEHTGKSDIGEIKECLLNIKYNEKNPVLFGIIENMDTKENEENGGVSFLDFLDEINEKLGDTKSQEGLHRIYDMFADENGNITKESIKDICTELSEGYKDPELQNALDNLTKNSINISFNEFEKIMTKKAYP